MCMVSDSCLLLSKVKLIKSWNHFNVMIIWFYSTLMGLRKIYAVDRIRTWTLAVCKRSPQTAWPLWINEIQVKKWRTLMKFFMLKIGQGRGKVWCKKNLTCILLCRSRNITLSAKIDNKRSKQFVSSFKMRYCTSL